MFGVYNLRVSRENLQIFTDSTSSLPTELSSKYGISVIPTLINFLGDPVTYRDGIDITPDHFLNKLTAGKGLPSSSSPPPEVFLDAYRQVDPQTRIISIHLGSGFSSVYQWVQVAAAQEPSDRVKVVDSESVSMGIGFLAIRAAQLVNQDANRDQILAELAEMKRRTTVIAAFDTVEFLRRGGRASNIEGIFASILNIKPIIEIRDNEIKSAGRERTLRRAHPQLVSMTEANKPFEFMAVMHAGAAASAQEVAGQIRHFYSGEIVIGDIGSVLATHGGPGLVGICYTKTPR